MHFKLEPNKNNRHKADTEFMVGTFVGYVWNTTEYIVVNIDGAFRCRTIRRMIDDQAYDPECVNNVKIRYDDFISDGLKSTFAGVRMGGQVADNPNFDDIPTRGGGSVQAPIPRRARLYPDDFRKNGYTIGCPGCECLQADIGERRGHSDECRERIEKHIQEEEDQPDGSTNRLRRAQSRQDHYAAKLGEEILGENAKGDKKEERDQDPRQHVQEPATPTEDDQMVKEAEADDGMDGLMEDMQRPDTPASPLKDGPQKKKDLRISSPQRNKAVKRGVVQYHDDELDTTVIIRDDGEPDMDDEAMFWNFGTVDNGDAVAKQAGPDDNDADLLMVGPDVAVNSSSYTPPPAPIRAGGFV